jgi:hypothetical protein
MRARQCLILAPIAALPLALGGCTVLLQLYVEHEVKARWPAPRSAAVHPLADRAVTVAGPLAVILGSQSVLAPADNRYLLDGLAVRLRQRFPQAVVMDSRQAFTATGSSTILQLDTTRDSSNARPAVVRAAVRVYDRSLQSVIGGPAVAVDLEAPDRNASLDELLAGLDARLQTLLFRK